MQILLPRVFFFPFLSNFDSSRRLVLNPDTPSPCRLGVWVGYPSIHHCSHIILYNQDCIMAGYCSTGHPRLSSFQNKDFSAHCRFLGILRIQRLREKTHGSGWERLTWEREDGLPGFPRITSADALGVPARFWILSSWEWKGLGRFMDTRVSCT